MGTLRSPHNTSGLEDSKQRETYVGLRPQSTRCTLPHDSTIMRVQASCRWMLVEEQVGRLSPPSEVEFLWWTLLISNHGSTLPSDVRPHSTHVWPSGEANNLVILAFSPALVLLRGTPCLPPHSIVIPGPSWKFFRFGSKPSTVSSAAVPNRKRFRECIWASASPLLKRLGTNHTPEHLLKASRRLRTTLENDAHAPPQCNTSVYNCKFYAAVVIKGGTEG